MNVVFFQQKSRLAPLHDRSHATCFWDWCCGGLLVLGALPFVVPFVLLLTPIRWNISASLPVGFYWETGMRIERGAYVHFCLPEDIAAYAFTRGYLKTGACPGLYEELFKPVAAVAGDTVEMRHGGGVRVNGADLDAPVFAADSQGRPHQFWIPEGKQIVPDGCVFVLSTHHPRSWDSRYFGFVPLAAIRGSAVPWWVWP